VYVDMDKFRQEKSAEYLALNPNGKVPLLVDEINGVNVWESCAIVYYLLDLFDPEEKLGPRKAFRGILLK
jgi:glutathione S-transferase